MAEKLFYSMGEVAEMFDVNQSLIRHWETQFGVLRPKRNKKGNRLFSPQDVETLKLIYHLVKERGMTLEGAKKALKQSSGDDGVRRDAELAERLQRIRSLLVEVREDLKVSGDGAVVTVEGEEPAADGDSPRSIIRSDAAAEAAEPVRRRGKAVVKMDENKTAETSHPKAENSVRRPRRKKEEDGTKELFAFYEQSLF